MNKTYGARFVQKNLWHSCGIFSVDDLLKGESQKSIGLFRNLVTSFKEIGPVTLHPAKTRVALMVQVRFASINRLGKDFINGHLWLRENLVAKNFTALMSFPEMILSATLKWKKKALLTWSSESI